MDSDVITFDQKNISAVSYIPFNGDILSYLSLNKISGLLHQSSQSKSPAYSNVQFEMKNLQSTIGLNYSHCSIESLSTRLIGMNTGWSMHNIQIKDKVMSIKTDGEITVESLEAYFEDKKINFKNLAWNFVLDEDKTNMNLKWDMTFQRAEYAGQIYGPLQLDFTINRLPTSLVDRIKRIEQSEMDENQKSIAIQNEVQYQDLDFDIALNNFKLKLPGGDLQVAGALHVLSELKDNVRDYERTKGNLVITVSKKALSEQLHKLFAALNGGKVQYTSEELINQLAQTGGLVDTGDYYESYLIAKNNRIFMNGSLGSGMLSKKLSCEIKKPLIPEHELLIAIWSDDAERVQSILKKGIQKDFDYKDIKHPLIEAAVLGNKTILDALFQYGFQVNQTDYDDNTALYWACRSGYQDIVKILLDGGANPNVVNHRGWTPLQEAAENGFKPIVELLIAKNVEINKVDADGRSALFWAATNNHSEIIKLLMEKGADPSLKNIRGASALDIAKERNHTSTIKVLEKI
jgi:hypothetical protein